MNALRVGMKVVPKADENVTITKSGLYLAGWVWPTVGIITEVHPNIRVALPAAACPSGWSKRGQEVVNVTLAEYAVEKLTDELPNLERAPQHEPHGGLT